MRLVALVIMLIVTVLLGLAATSARADSEARQGADFVRTTELACTDSAVVALIENAGGDVREWHAAHAEIGGQPFEACWRRMDSSRLLVVYSDGDAGFVPVADLKPVRDT